MKICLQLAVIVALFFAGCTGKKETSGNAATHIDSLNWCNTVVERDSISELEFEKQAGHSYDTSEENNLLRDSATVKRRGDSLILNINSKQLVFVNNASDNSDSFADYRYLGFDKDVKKYVVFCSLWEWYHYLLIDKETADTTITCGSPVASPDRKFFICGNADLIAQFTFNGLELYENSHKPRLICQQELNEWGPQDIKWITSDMLLIKATVLDTTIGNMERTAFYRLNVGNLLRR